MNAKSMQVEVMKTYLSVAPMFLGALSMTMRTAEKAVVNSASIQKRARSSEKNAYVIATKQQVECDIEKFEVDAVHLMYFY